MIPHIVFPAEGTPAPTRHRGKFDTETAVQTLAGLAYFVSQWSSSVSLIRSSNSTNANDTEGLGLTETGHSEVSRLSDPQ